MRAFLDACVLVPTALRGILLRMAEAGAFEPVWSERVFDEWTRADLRLHPDAGGALAVEQALLRDRWRLSMVHGDAALEAQIALPDENDIHVLAAAVTGRADFLVTANTRDFPQSAMTRFGVGLRHPDAFLLQLFDERADDLVQAAAVEHDLAKKATREEFTKRAFLKRIGLPRVAKALT